MRVFRVQFLVYTSNQKRDQGPSSLEINRVYYFLTKRAVCVAFAIFRYMSTTYLVLSATLRRPVPLVYT